VRLKQALRADRVCVYVRFLFLLRDEHRTLDSRSCAPHPAAAPRLPIRGTSLARRDGPAWGIAQEAMLAFTLGLAVA
jgi:hypothetical protein